MESIMKLKFTGKILPFIAVACLSGCMSTGPHLKSSISEGVGALKARLPYTEYVNYFGYVDKNVKPQGKYKNKDAYYLYAWVPAAIDEIGISMISPAFGTPASGDFVDANFEKNGIDDKFFDTYIALERMDIIDNTKIAQGGRAIQTLAQNDDSSELPKNPSGASYNSLLRETSSINNPQDALVRGVYRITFTSFRSSVEGSYEATIGTNIPGVKIAASLEELDTLVNAQD